MDSHHAPAGTLVFLVFPLSSCAWYKTIPDVIIITESELMPGALNQVIAHVPGKMGSQTHQHHIVTRS